MSCGCSQRREKIKKFALKIYRKILPANFKVEDYEHIEKEMKTNKRNENGK